MRGVPGCYNPYCRDTGQRSDINIDNISAMTGFQIWLGYQTAYSVVNRISPLLPNMPFIQ